MQTNHMAWDKDAGFSLGMKDESGLCEWSDSKKIYQISRAIDLIIVFLNN